MKNTQSEIDIIKLESRAASVEEKLKSLETRQNKLEERQNSSEKRQDLLDEKLKPIFNTINIALGVITTSAVTALILVIANQLINNGK